VLSLPAERIGETFIDVEALAEVGIADRTPYGGGAEPDLDFFVDPR
jgi:citronellol/citronellal dehydrogenase